MADVYNMFLEAYFKALDIAFKEYAEKYAGFPFAILKTTINKSTPLWTCNVLCGTAENSDPERVKLSIISNFGKYNVPVKVTMKSRTRYTVEYTVSDNAQKTAEFFAKDFEKATKAEIDYFMTRAVQCYATRGYFSIKSDLKKKGYIGVFILDNPNQMPTSWWSEKAKVFEATMEICNLSKIKQTSVDLTVSEMGEPIARVWYSFDFSEQCIKDYVEARWGRMFLEF